MVLVSSDQKMRHVIEEGHEEVRRFVGRATQRFQPDGQVLPRRKLDSDEDVRSMPHQPRAAHSRSTRWNLHGTAAILTLCLSRPQRRQVQPRFIPPVAQTHDQKPFGTSNCDLPVFALP